jgi:porphobilinogen synthase
MRRTRRHDWSRRLVAESSLSPADFIWPVFVIEGENKREAVASMPGVERLSVDLVVKAAQEAADLGLPVIKKTPKGGRSIDAEVLEELADKHELPRVVLEQHAVQEGIGEVVEQHERCAGAQGLLPALQVIV